MERYDKVAILIKELTAKYISRENNRTSLITVTNCDTSPDLKNATIYITVLPTDKENTALDFLKRNRKNIREFLKKNMETKTIPFIDIKIDQGEKNRQKIDELLKNG